MRRFARSKTDNNETLEEVEPLILQGLSDLLSRPGLNHTNRNWSTHPLTVKEHVFIVTTLYKELEDPKLPAGLLFLYGRILDYIKYKTLYN